MDCITAVMRPGTCVARFMDDGGVAKLMLVLKIYTASSVLVMCSLRAHFLAGHAVVHFFLLGCCVFIPTMAWSQENVDHWFATSYNTSCPKQLSALWELALHAIGLGRVAVDAEWSDYCGGTFLHFAAKRGHVQAVRTFKALGANLSAEDWYRFRPMDVAVRNSSIEETHCLAVCMELPPADIPKRSSHNKMTPLDMAVNYGFKTVVVWMLQQCTWTWKTLKSAKKYALPLAINEHMWDILYAAEVHHNNWTDARKAFVAACVFASTLK